jgi:hypothetical protein
MVVTFLFMCAEDNGHPPANSIGAINIRLSTAEARVLCWIFSRGRSWQEEVNTSYQVSPSVTFSCVCRICRCCLGQVTNADGSACGQRPPDQVSLAESLQAV